MGARTRSNGAGAPPRGRWLVASVAALLVVGSIPAPSGARTGQGDDRTRAAIALADTLALAPDSPPSPDDPFVDVVAADEVVSEAALTRLQTSAAATQADAALVVAVGERDAAQAVVDAAKAVRNAARTELVTEQDRLSDLTVQAYVTGGEVDFEKYREIMQGDTSDPAAGRQIMFTQVLDRQIEVTDGAAADLKVARAELAQARDALEVAQAAAAAALTESAARRRAHTEAEAAHLAAVAEAADARDALRRAAAGSTPLVPQDIPLIGLPRLSAEDLAEWFARSPYRPRVSTPIEDYAAWFIAEGATEGIRGDIAFAQAVLETGGFANNDSVAANNFSGIGHCDTCGSGWSFPTPELGVRAQIQLLKSYAVKKPAYANDLVDRRLRGPAGCCPTWGDLTTVWATDPTYGPKVMLLYTSMVDFALDRRAAGQG